MDLALSSEKKKQEFFTRILLSLRLKLPTRCTDWPLHLHAYANTRRHNQNTINFVETRVCPAAKRIGAILEISRCCRTNRLVDCVPAVLTHCASRSKSLCYKVVPRSGTGMCSFIQSPHNNAFFLISPALGGRNGLLHSSSCPALSNPKSHGRRLSRPEKDIYRRQCDFRKPVTESIQLLDRCLFRRKIHKSMHSLPEHHLHGTRPPY
jgi:hypothetical protein